jgi:hypothetical protein
VKRKNRRENESEDSSDLPGTSGSKCFVLRECRGSDTASASDASAYNYDAAAHDTPDTADHAAGPNDQTITAAAGSGHSSTGRTGQVASSR